MIEFLFDQYKEYPTYLIVLELIAVVLVLSVFCLLEKTIFWFTQRDWLVQFFTFIFCLNFNCMAI